MHPERYNYGAECNIRQRKACKFHKPYSTQAVLARLSLLTSVLTNACVVGQVVHLIL